MKVFSALKDDVHQGWVWLENTSLPPRGVICITNLSNGKRIYCEALQIDGNFLKNYNISPRISITEPKDSVVMGAWYRSGLGVSATQVNINLQIKACNSLIGKFRASIGHPQIVVRQGTWLGGIGFLLGLIGLVLGILSLC
ncbi:hypothetical protein [Bordetella bronchiseptica]|uniref:hypothetical protein n=1 Tax=Bordetella bronchiseptica TaxID=518 RepID=UPI000FD7A737|nr:hypothetical protein [Bordetella bronchiseptica]